MLENESEKIDNIIFLGTVYRREVDNMLAINSIPDGERLVFNVRLIYINIILDMLQRLGEYAKKF